MPKQFSRRDFLAAAASATALGVSGCGPTETCATGPDGKVTCALPEPLQAPFDTVVVLMMENRSFDHMLGWLPGANGRQDGLAYLDEAGISHATWPIAPDFQGCQYQDPDHTWKGIAIQYADGRCDGFLKTREDRSRPQDLYPVSYYRKQDLPILAALAEGYTTFDNYFCSMQGPTWENRLYQLTGTTQVGMDEVIGHFPRTDAERPCTIGTAIFDRVREARLRTAYYYHGEPMTGLFKSKRYDGFVASVYNALKDSPQWGRMVFVLNFDEHGGFFDHVVPPPCQDDTVQTGPGPFPDLKRLGFRVPAIAMGPFAPRKVETAGPYEHCSVLRMIEWRWDLAPMTTRDRTAKNLADALDFKNTRPALALPPFTPPPNVAC